MTDASMYTVICNDGRLYDNWVMLWRLYDNWVMYTVICNDGRLYAYRHL